MSPVHNPESITPTAHPLSRVQHLEPGVANGKAVTVDFSILEFPPCVDKLLAYRHVLGGKRVSPTVAKDWQ